MLKLRFEKNKIIPTIIGYSIIVLILIGVIGFGVDVIYAYINHKKLKNNNKTTVGNVINFDYKSEKLTTTITLEYYINNIQYRKKLSNGITVVYGSKYKVKYYPENPNIIEVLYEEPVFLENEKTAFTTGVIKNANLLSSGSIVVSYIVNKKTYIIYYNVKKILKKRLKDGMKFKVEYWVKKPKRCIIHFKE